jgi:C4-dicarboxylate-binding protein DctP
MVVTSKEFWMSVPDAERKIIKKALDEAIAFGNEVAAQKSVDDRQKIIDSKRTEIIELDDATRSQWVEAMKPVWEEFEKEIGKDMIDAAYKSNM